jgi:hypothetical protein
MLSSSTNKCLQVLISRCTVNKSSLPVYNGQVNAGYMHCTASRSNPFQTFMDPLYHPLIATGSWSGGLLARHTQPPLLIHSIHGQTTIANTAICPGNGEASSMFTTEETSAMDAAANALLVAASAQSRGKEHAQILSARTTSQAVPVPAS